MVVVVAFSILLAAASLATAGPPFGAFIDPRPRDGNRFGETVVALSTGNVVITSPGDDAAALNAGAVYLFNGATGALISTLTGSRAHDSVGSGGVIKLTNGNYVVGSPAWDNGTVIEAGAVTWGNGTTGISGVVSASNSLVGTTAHDRVGSEPGVPLTNGNYVVSAPNWDNGTAADAGAVTWGNGTTGITGPVSALNSLVGSAANDRVGDSFELRPSVVALTNGNYVVRSPRWDNGSVADAGAATWGNGATGISGPVSMSNSLFGSTAQDSVGIAAVALTNGNYVVSSPKWANGEVARAGAVTWGSGTTGITGPVSSLNSVFGSRTDDSVGSAILAFPPQVGVVPLTNGNYLVDSPYWDNGAVVDAGAVTWGNGTTGTSGPVSALNSLVSPTANSNFYLPKIVALTNGNYVASSPGWSNGAVAHVGAVTWGNGATGTFGVVSVSNSLVGSTAGDRVGSGISALTNGNYVVSSVYWANGAAVEAGAVTWGNGVSGTTGTVSATNSLIGSAANDRVSGVVPLPNGNYVVSSWQWDNGAVADAGAATWGNGLSGTFGPVSVSNSLVGSATQDFVGDRSVTALTNGNYVVASPNWANGAVARAGAVTWGNGALGTVGTVSASNSLVGSTTNDRLGTIGFGSTEYGTGVVALSNGNYVVTSSEWRNGSSWGAVTWANGSTGNSGPVSGSNSLVGGVVRPNLRPVVVDDVNKTYFARFLNEGGGTVRLGSQIDGIRPSSGQSAQSISFGTAPTVSVYGTGALSATASSGLPVTFSALTLQTCSVSGSTVSGHGAGACTIAANQAGNAAFGPAPQVTQSFTITTGSAPRLVNISTRGLVETGDNVMIGGFIIGGSAPKKVVIRGRGPSLTDYNVPGALADPTIKLLAGSTEVASNDNWQQAANAAQMPAALAPDKTAEAAIVTTVSPGVAYTVHLSGVSNTTGVGLIEVFEADLPDIPMLNISTRGKVGTGDDVMIGGFIIQGDAAQRVLIVAKGPSLGQAPFNVPGALADPTLELYQGSTVIESNDNWGDSANVAAIQATGNAPSHALEAAIIRTLAPGAYTAIVRGKNGATGVGLVEVYAK